MVIILVYFDLFLFSNLTILSVVKIIVLSMKIYVNKNKKNHGPYSLADLQSYLDKGIFSETDYCCYDGKSWVRLNAVPGIKLIDEDQIVEEESEQETDADEDTISKSRIILKLIPIFLLGLLAGLWLFFTSPWSFLPPSLFLSGYNILSLAVLIYLALKVLRFFKGEEIKECNSRFLQTKLLFYSGLLLCSMIVMLSPLLHSPVYWKLEIFLRIFPAILFIYSIVKLYFLRGEALDGNSCISDGLQKSKKDSTSESSKENGFNLKQKVGAFLKFSTVYFPGFLLVILVSVYSFNGLFNLGEEFPPPLFSCYAGAALVPTLLAYGAIILLGILRSRKSGKKSDDLLLGKLFLSLSILMVAFITTSMQLPDYRGYSSHRSFGELFIDESFFAQHVIAYPAAVFGFFNVIFLAVKFPWRFIVKRLVIYSALASLGGCTIFAYFYYFIEPKYLWDDENGEFRDVRTIWAKNRKLVEKNEERDVIDLEFYFWDRSEPFLLEGHVWSDSYDIVWSTRSGYLYPLSYWFGYRLLVNENSWNDSDRNWDIKLWLENIGIELHLGYKGLPEAFWGTSTIISILDDPAMGTTFYWGEQQIDISQVAKIVNRDPSQKVFIRVAWGNLSDFSFSSGNNGSLIQDIIGGIRDGGYKDPIQAVLIDDHGINHCIDDLETRLDDLIKRWDENKKKSSQEIKFNPKTGLNTSYYDSGKKKAEFEFLDGKKNIKFTMWYESGNKMSEGVVMNGELSGLVSKWHENGILASEFIYENGKKDGESIEWDENGKMIRQGTWVNDELVTEMKSSQ